MITLITYPSAFGSPAASPFCVKAMWLLNLSGQPWKREDTKDPRKMPHQKLPVIRTNGELIADSHNIRTYLESQGADFDVGLSDMEKASSRAFIQMAEEHLYFHLVLDRWTDDQVWPILRDTYFDTIPNFFREFIAGKLRKSLMQGMKTQGLGRFSAQERMDRIEPDLKAITTRLWHGQFLFGDGPTAADASVAAMLDGMRATPAKTELKLRIAEDEILCRYIDRCADRMGSTISAVSERLYA